jgi:acyl-CoA thioesterase II
MVVAQTADRIRIIVMGALRDVLSIRRVDEAQGDEASSVDRFTVSPPGEGFLFAGLSMAIGIATAQATVDDDLVPKSLHSIFERPGRWGPELHVDVIRENDSRNFALRRVLVNQNGRTLAEQVVLLHRPEKGDDGLASPAPEVPDAGRLLVAAHGLPWDVVELRPVHPHGTETWELMHPYWARFGEVTLETKLRAPAVAFITDYGMTYTPFPRGSTDGTKYLSQTLSHTIWFHRQWGTEWLLLSARVRSTIGGRYLSEGEAHDEDGFLVATFVQEGLLSSVPSRPWPGTERSIQ